MNTVKNENENPNINFWGLQISCKTITPRLLILVLIILTFFVAVVALLKVYILPVLGALGTKKATAALGGKAKAFLSLFRRGSP